MQRTPTQTEETTRAQVAILGPGATGCLFAARMAEAGIDVQLLDKDPDRAQCIDHDGIRLVDAQGERRVSVPATADAHDIGEHPVILVCVKTYDTEAALRHARPLIGRHTVLASLQNGIGPLEILKHYADPDRLVRGVTSQGAHRLGPGHVRHAGTGPTRLACAQPDQIANAERVAALFNAAGMPAEVTGDSEALLWSKLVVNAAINPLTSIANVRNGALLDHPKLRSDLHATAHEAAAVARARGIALLFADEIEEVEAVCRATGDNISSMLQDIRSGRRTEIDAITGTVVREARARGVPTPMNEKLWIQIQTMQARR